MSKPIALVTGASGGIGADLALELAKDGHDLILVARTAAAMEELAARLTTLYGAKSTVIPADLTEPGAAVRLVQEIENRGLVIDVLVNNAGFGDNAPFHEADPARLSAMLQLNVVALTELTRAVLPAMIARNSGRILLVASTAAFQPGPEMAVYCASKAYVLSLGEAVAFELKGTGVSLTTLCPGATRTGFAAAAQAEGNALFAMMPVMRSEDVARIGYQALKNRRPVVVSGLMNKIMALSGRLSPHCMSLPLARMMMGSH